ncbi:MAG: HlyD family efflux transporter periplasmic adaptor subunit [Candidatus Dormibacteraeota bacterium]|nr:HlyD family efflux transporter periplasmic adaptor subunit [Candidatus Dormibacteraeota bacterium]
MQQGLFRQVALGRLTSPDQLDRQMRVADSKGWVALVTLVAITLGIVGWGIVGSITTSVRGQGLIANSGGTYSIVTTSAGVVYDLLVKRGDHVAEGQPVALIETSPGVRVNVPSPFSGSVVELLATFGDYVTIGTPIVNFASDEESLQALLYLPATVAEQVRPGMAVQVSPSTVSRAEYGFIDARVLEVAPFPSTQRGMMASLNNESLVQHLFAVTGGTPVEVQVGLQRARTPSGFRWSSSSGPPAQLRGGTLCFADVVLRTQRPISFVLPVAQ